VALQLKPPPSPDSCSLKLPHATAPPAPEPAPEAALPRSPAAPPVFLHPASSSSLAAHALQSPCLSPEPSPPCPPFPLKQEPRSPSSVVACPYMPLSAASGGEDGSSPGSCPGSCSRWGSPSGQAGATCPTLASPESELRPRPAGERTGAAGGHVFISYQWNSQPAVLAIARELKRRGYRVWIDLEKMRGDMNKVPISDPARSKQIQHSRRVLCSGWPKRSRGRQLCCRALQRSTRLPSTVSRS